jgi:hypothetical protein
MIIRILQSKGRKDRFAAWLRRSPDTATADEVRRLQL